MATSIRQFNAELYREHLEEASFLYEQRLAYLHDPELGWRDLDEPERRLDAHLDALVVGDEQALAVAAEQCPAGDFGELHAALRLFCRRDRYDLALSALHGLDDGDERLVQAAIDALKAECPPAWHDELIRAALDGDARIGPLAAPVLGFRRAQAEETLLGMLSTCSESGVANVLWSLGRVGGERAKAALGAYLGSADDGTAEAACRALIRLGDDHALRHGLLVAQMKPWPVTALGVGGNRTAVNVLTELVKSGAAGDEALVALGLLGEPGSVGTAFKCLEDPERAAAAAIALQTITGAELYEEVFVAEEIDPEELFDEERERYEQTGELPTRPDGEPFGSSVTRLSIDPDAWSAWLAENKRRFQSGVRYRHGLPCGPRALAASLAAEHTPNRVRALICDELVVRYGAPVRLEIDMPVREQLSHLAELSRWAEDNEARFQPGLWYFAGRVMD